MPKFSRENFENYIALTPDCVFQCENGKTSERFLIAFCIFRLFRIEKIDKNALVFGQKCAPVCVVGVERC